MTQKRLLVFGNSYMNFNMKARRAPERGETVISNLEHSLVPGGHGVVSAITAAKYGTDVVFCTRIGEDENGEKLINAFKQNNIDTRFVKFDKRKPTGLNAITVEDKTSERIITYPGANSSLSFDDIESAFMCYPDAVLINFDLRDDLILDVSKFARDAKIPLIVSCGKEYKSFHIEDFDEIEVFMPNRETTFLITGIDPVDANSALHACVKLIKKIKCKYIVIKLGERGAFAFDGVFSEIIPAHEVEVIDTNMAGTVFSAAFTHMYLSTSDIIEAAKFANAAACLKLKSEGFYDAIPSLYEIDELLKNK